MKNNIFFNNCLSILILFLSLNLNAQIGIGTTDPKTTLDINGSLSLREGPALSLTNGNNNNISLGLKPYSQYRIIGPTDSFTITGIIPIPGTNGQIITLQNTTSQIMMIGSENASSSTSNRILIPSGNNIVSNEQYATITLIYNSSISRWLVTNKSGSNRWFYPPINIVMGTSNVLTGALPAGVVSNSSTVSISIVGDWLSAPDVTIQYVEVRTDNSIRFVVTNNTPTFPFGTSYNNMQFVITINN